MKHSIRYKITALIIVIMAISVGSIGVFSTVFMEKFYTNKKQAAIKEVYKTLQEIVAKDPDLEDSKNSSKLNSICETDGATLIIVDVSGQSVYSYGPGKNLADRWASLVYGKNINGNKGTVIESKKDYTLQYMVDDVTSDKHYELYSVLDNGNFAVIRMSVENFKESVAITNQFYLILGVVVILITTIVILFFMNRYTKALLSLADISKRMSKLDFNVKYQGHYKDELVVLGESINEMSEKLEETITELKSANIELKKDIAKKEEVDEMRKEFISNVSHELKTPIALIQGYAEGLQEGISDNPEDVQYYCDVIVDEAAKMNKMVKNLLTLNQLEFGGTQVNLERFDIVSVIEGVINSIGIKAQQKGANITFRHREPVSVWADEFQIEEVITNYLSNAINHVDAKKIINVEITEKNGIVRVSVFNSGKQIPESELENIWIKFYKVDKARTRAYGGNGIGLSIVKAIMDRHGMGCGVNNYADGVEFWFELDSRINPKEGK